MNERAPRVSLPPNRVRTSARRRLGRRIGWTLIYLAAPLPLVGVGAAAYALGGRTGLLWLIGGLAGLVAWELAGLRTRD